MEFINMGLPKGKDIWNILFLSDIHSLEADKKALLLVLKAFAQTPIETRKIILGGDILDIKFLYQKDEEFSHAKKYKYFDEYFFPKLDEERVWWEEFYNLIRTYVMNPEDIYFIEGNHEERLRRKYFTKIIPHDLKHNFVLENVLGAKERKLKVISYKDWLYVEPLRYPRMHWTHGHHVGITFLKKHVEELNRGAVMVGHLHEKQAKGFRRAENTVISYANPCLCHLNADYMENRATNWNQGASLITLSRWEWSVVQYLVINKKLYLPNGEVLK